MKISFKKKSTKVIAIAGLALATLIPGIMSLTPNNASADQANQIPKYELEATHTIARNDAGGGPYGTHVYPSYTEDGVQYYRDGDIIELTIAIPKDHGSVGIKDVVAFDRTKVQLLSEFRHIRLTIAESFMNSNWTNFVSMYEERVDTFTVDAIADNYTTDSEWEGGTFAKAYFRVLDNVESEAGTEIKFDFPAFQSIAHVNNTTAYTHKGYDPANDAGTATYEAPSISIISKKPTVVIADPVLELSANTVNIYEGDMFDPTAQIVSASDPKDSSVTKDSVVISEGTQKFTKHQPVAGNYAFKYTVKSGITNKTTEKTLNLSVTPRTYDVSSINVEDKKLEVPVGTTSADFEKMVDKIKDQDFDVTIASNDGSSFVVSGKVLSGTTDTYQVDAQDKLIAQNFNVNYKIAMPLISYSTTGTRVVTPYNGNPGFVSNVTPGEMDAVIAVNVSTTATPGGTGNTGSNNNEKVAPSTDPNANANARGTNTGDTTNTALLFMLAGFTLLIPVGLKLKKDLSK